MSAWSGSIAKHGTSGHGVSFAQDHQVLRKTAQADRRRQLHFIDVSWWTFRSQTHSGLQRRHRTRSDHLEPEKIMKRLFGLIALGGAVAAPAAAKSPVHHR